LKAGGVLASENIPGVLIHSRAEVEDGRRKDSASRLSIMTRSSSNVRVVRIPDVYGGSHVNIKIVMS